MYKLTTTGGVVIVATGEVLPEDVTAPARLAYLDWLQAGNVPEPADVAAPLVPATVYKWQAIFELSKRGLWSAVELYLADPTTPWETKIAWENIREIDRDNPLLAAFATRMEWTPQFLDDFFIAANDWQIK